MIMLHRAGWRIRFGTESGTTLALCWSHTINSGYGGERQTCQALFLFHLNTVRMSLFGGNRCLLRRREHTNSRHAISPA